MATTSNPIPTYQSPGVYIQELPTNNIIQGVSTDVAAFIGISESGIYNEPLLISSWNEFVSNFGGFIFGRYLAFAVYSFFYEGGTNCYIVRTQPTQTSGKGASPSISIAPLTILPTSLGDWSKNIVIQIANHSAGKDLKPGQPSPMFIMRVLVSKSNISGTQAAASFGQMMLNDYVNTNSILPTKLDSTDYYILESYGPFSNADLTRTSEDSPCNLEKIVNNSIFIRVQVPIGTGTRPQNGFNPFTNSTSVTFDFSSSIASLEPIVGFSIVSMPDSVSYSTSSGKINQADQIAVINELLTNLQQRGDAFAVVDPSFDLDANNIITFKEGGSVGNALTSSYGALYYPWIYIINPNNAMQIAIPPSGAVAGCYAATDQSVGVFQVAAGVNEGKLNIATSLEYQITQNQQNTINPAGINVIRSFLKYGILIWGARTLSPEIPLQYVNVRRLLIYIEQSIYQGIQWAVFEANNQSLWDGVSRDITAFLTPLWQEGALVGSTANQAFTVICNSTNNSPQTMEEGYLIVDVAVAPVRPAEFIVIRIQQLLQNS